MGKKVLDGKGTNSTEEQPKQEGFVDGGLVNYKDEVDDSSPPTDLDSFLESV